MKPEHEKQTPNDTECPNCGGNAQWAYTDPEATQVLITCPDCGRIEMTREEFDCAEADLPGAVDNDA